MHRAEVNNIGMPTAASPRSTSAGGPGEPAPFAVPQFDTLIAASRHAWDGALAHGEKHGYRNSQVTVLAPTGTIGFMMDCDTTGVEPDLALVKYKKLVGGGMIKIVNNTVPSALIKLGYSESEMNAIVSYIDATGTIEGAPGIKPEHLAVFDCSFKPAKGTRSIHYMGHIKMMAATQPFLSGAISKTVNLPQDCSVQDIADAYVEAWRQGIKAVAIYRDNSKGTQPLNVSAQTSEDKKGTRATNVPVAAATPTPAASTEALNDAIFLSAARGSEAFVVPTSAGNLSVDEAALHIATSDHKVTTLESQLVALTRELDQILNASTQNSDSLDALGPPRAVRHRLPGERASVTHKFALAGHEGYITVGLYPNGSPGEIFIRMAKEGSTVSGLMDSFATAISISLQHGVPLRVLCEKFAHTRFEPSGWTGNPEIGYAKSIMDYIFRWIQIRFLSGHQLDLFAGMTAHPAAVPVEGAVTAPNSTVVPSATAPSAASPFGAINQPSPTEGPSAHSTHSTHDGFALDLGDENNETSDVILPLDEGEGKDLEAYQAATSATDLSAAEPAPIPHHYSTYFALPSFSAAVDASPQNILQREARAHQFGVTSAPGVGMNQSLSDQDVFNNGNGNGNGHRPTSGSYSPYSDVDQFEDRTPPQSGIAPDLAASNGLSQNLSSRPEPRSGAAERPAPSYQPEDRGLYAPAEAMRAMYDMGDAPSCATCGAIMTRSGSCYRCMSCGSTSGCS